MENILKNIDFESIFGSLVDSSLLKNDDLNFVCNTIFDTLKPPPPFNTLDKTWSTNDVFLNNKYLDQKVVIKRIPYEMQFDKNEVIMEVIVHAVFYAISKDNILSAPKPMA